MPPAARRANWLIARARRGSRCSVSPSWRSASPKRPARAASICAAASSPARLLSQRPVSQLLTASASRSCRSSSPRPWPGCRGSFCRLKAKRARPSSSARTGWFGSTAMSMVSFLNPSMIASASRSSRPARRRIQLALVDHFPIKSSLASSVRPAQVTRASTIGTCRSAVIAASSRLRPSTGETSIARSRPATADLTMPPSCSSSSDPRMSASSRDAPWRSRPSPGGWARKR